VHVHSSNTQAPRRKAIQSRGLLPPHYQLPAVVVVDVSTPEAQDELKGLPMSQQSLMALDCSWKTISICVLWAEHAVAACCAV
jgi:hypothetical protein